jgi:hypothetical protein
LVRGEFLKQEEQSYQLASQTQNGETIGYNLDPSGRTREVVSTGKTTQDVINHYAGGGNAPAWTVERPSGDYRHVVRVASMILVIVESYKGSVVRDETV